MTAEALLKAETQRYFVIICKRVEESMTFI